MNHREAAPDGGLLAIQIRLFGVTIPARLPEQPAVAEDIQDRYPLEKFVAHEFPVDQVDKARPKPSIDWLVASETFAGKPTALINTSPRAFHAQASLREILSTMAARLTPEAFVSIALTGKAVTADDILADTVCARRLKELLEALIAATRSC